MSQVKSKFKNDITLRWKIVTDTQAGDGVYFGYNISFYNRIRSKRIVTASLTTEENSHSNTFLPSTLNFIMDGYFYCTVRELPTNENSLLVDVFAFNKVGNGYISTIAIKRFNKDLSFNGMKFHLIVLFFTWPILKNKMPCC